MFQSSSPLPRPFTVVVGVDFSPSSDRALATAQMLCSLSGGCRLHAVHVLSPVDAASAMAGSPLGYSEKQVAPIRARLASRVRFAGLPAGSEITLHVLTGFAHELIIGVARDYGADLILVGMPGLRGVRRVRHSLVSEHVNGDAPCTVITVRPREVPAEEYAEEYADLGHSPRGCVNSYT